MRIGINLIALPTEKGSGAFRYIQMLLQAMGEYEIRNCEFIIYKQTQISERYIGIPNSLNVKYVSVPNLGMGIKRVIFEQTLFYKYLEPCDVLYIVLVAAHLMNFKGQLQYVEYGSLRIERSSRILKHYLYFFFKIQHQSIQLHF